MWISHCCQHKYFQIFHWELLQSYRSFSAYMTEIVSPLISTWFNFVEEEATTGWVIVQPSNLHYWYCQSVRFKWGQNVNRTESISLVAEGQKQDAFLIFAGQQKHVLLAPEVFHVRENGQRWKPTSDLTLRQAVFSYTHRRWRFLAFQNNGQKENRRPFLRCRKSLIKFILFIKHALYAELSSLNTWLPLKWDWSEKLEALGRSQALSFLNGSQCEL